MIHQNGWMFEDECQSGIIFGKRFGKNGWILQWVGNFWKLIYQKVWMFEWGNFLENHDSQEEMDV